MTYSLAGLGMLATLVIIFRQDFGTHRLMFHVVSIGLFTGYFAIAGRTWDMVSHLKQLLAFRAGQQWLYSALLLGLVSALVRIGVYLASGFGGIEFYSRMFGPLLAAEDAVRTAARWCVFGVVLYGAVITPGLFFCGVAQEVFRRAGFLAIGIAIQAVVFGFVHCYMSGTVNVGYGLEAATGAVIYGLYYYYSRSLHPPALFMWANVFVCTLFMGYHKGGCVQAQ